MHSERRYLLPFITAVLSVITPILGIGVWVLDHQKDQAKSSAASLTREKAELELSVSQLKSEQGSLASANAGLQKQGDDLRKQAESLKSQLRSAGITPQEVGVAGPSSYTLKVPLPPSGSGYSTINLDTGKILTTGFGSGELRYGRDSTTGQAYLDLPQGYTAAWSTDVASPNPGQADCAGAVDRAPRSRSITDFSAPLNVCLRTEGRGIALVRVLGSAAADGTLSLQETYWPAS
jgi:hypothetical protein